MSFFLKRSIAFWFGITFLIAAIGLVPVVISEKHTHEALLAAGETTPAAVVDHGERQEGDDKKSHWLRLTYYDLTQKEHTTEIPASQQVFDQAPIGTTIQVRYLKDKPAVVRLESALPNPEWRDLLALTLTIGLIGVLIVTLAVIKARRVLALRAA